MNTQEAKYFKTFRKEAERISTDKEKMQDLLGRVREKTRNNKYQLKNVWENIQTLTRMLRTYASGRYREIPFSRIVLVVAALVYLVSPVDAIMDFLPFGLVDDAAVIGWLVNLMSNEITHFKAWERSEAREI